MAVIAQDMNRYGTLDIRVLFCLIKNNNNNNNNRTCFISDVGNNYA
jgi:hypothetical protein